MMTVDIERSQKPGATAQKPAEFFGARHVQYLLMFIIIVIAYGMRTILNVAIVAMIEEDPNHEKDYPTYPEWSTKKNLMLSSFFWGYVCLQVFAGLLAKNYGAKRFLFGAILINAVFTTVIPVFGAQFGYQGVMACRIIMGAGQGFLFPSIHTLLSSWTSISERAKWGGLVYAGQPVGNVLAMPIAGVISASAAGWPIIFYLYGGLGLFWCILWFFFGSSSPSDHKSISETERKYIESELDEHEIQEKVSTPWKAIFTSIPFWAILLTHACQNWGFWTLLTEIPSYMQSILKFNIASNSLLSALPYFVMFILNMVMSPIADWLIDRKIVNLGVSRKIFNTIGLFTPALALIILSCVGSSNRNVVILLLVVAVGFNAGQYCGFNLNHIDISPVYAGTLMGITNSVAAVFSIMAPLAVDLVQEITGYGETDESLWNIVFSIAATLYLIGGTIFIVFGSGEVQSWNNHAGKQKVTKAHYPKKISIVRLE